MAEQNFNQAIKSAADLKNNELVKQYYLGL